MTTSHSTMIQDQIVDCMANGREPTALELAVVAKRMWVEGAAGRSAFSWGDLPSESSSRLIAFQVARLALSGQR